MKSSALAMGPCLGTAARRLDGSLKAGCPSTLPMGHNRGGLGDVRQALLDEGLAGPHDELRSIEASIGSRPEPARYMS